MVHCVVPSTAGEGGGEGRGGEVYEFVSTYIHARVCACVCVCVYRFEGQVLILWMVWFVVCTSVFVLVVVGEWWVWSLVGVSVHVLIRCIVWHTRLTHMWVVAILNTNEVPTTVQVSAIFVPYEVFFGASGAVCACGYAYTI